MGGEGGIGSRHPRGGRGEAGVPTGVVAVVVEGQSCVTLGALDVGWGELTCQCLLIGMGGTGETVA